MGYAIVYFHGVSPAVVAPELTRSFHIKGVALGVLASAYFYPYAIMQLPSGLLSDSFGPRKTVTIFTLVASGGAILFGISTGSRSSLDLDILYEGNPLLTVSKPKLQGQEQFPDVFPTTLY